MGKPPILFLGGLTNRVFCSSAYTTGADGLMHAVTKYDVTEQVEAMAEALGWRPPVDTGQVR